MARIAMLGTGLIGMFYTVALQGKRRRDEVTVVYGRDPERTKTFAEKHAVPRWTTDMADAIRDPETDAVVIGLPNHLHKEWAIRAVQAGKHIYNEKPLTITPGDARSLLAEAAADGCDAAAPPAAGAGAAAGSIAAMLGLRLEVDGFPLQVTVTEPVAPLIPTATTSGSRPGRSR